MTCTVLYGGRTENRDEWQTALTRELRDANLDVSLVMAPEDIPPERVDYLLAQTKGAVTDYSPYTNLRAVLSLWAGVEWLLNDPTVPPDVPLVRMVESGMTQGMVEYVTGHVLRYHLGLDALLAGTATERWGESERPLAYDCHVGVMGLGALGKAVAEGLAALGFRVSGWSRTLKTIPNVTAYSDRQQLGDFLSGLDILVLLMPLTQDTECIINADTLAQLPNGVRIINAARGALIDDDALVSALATGHIAHATLDVFRTEPLPADSPFRDNSRVTITTHIASVTVPDTAAKSIAWQIARGESGQPFEHVVDRQLGY